jgi:hypothetical protein
MLGQIVGMLFILVGALVAIGHLLAGDGTIIWFAYGLSLVIVGCYLLSIANSLVKIEEELIYQSKKAKFDSAYLKLLAYSNAPLEDLVVMASNDKLFTSDQRETLKPMVDLLTGLEEKHAQGNQA